MSRVEKIDLSALGGDAPDISKKTVKKNRQKEKKAKRKKGKRTEKGMAMEKYTRGEKNSLKGVTSRALRSKLKESEKIAQQSIEESARAEILLPSEAGYLEADEGGVEQTWKVSQDVLKEHIDERSRQKVFDLDLDQFGPYTFNFTRNGRHLIMGGRKGHIGLMNWGNMSLTSELHLRETVRDVTFLHDETMYAVAQKKYLYVYDQQGTELHCLKHHFDVNALEFLPYHFLLVSVGKTGYLKYIDTSTGGNVAEHRTKMGECKVMKQNKSNAIICLGHGKGTVSMWSPNMSTPLVKMMCHRGPITDIAIDRGGYYMATSGLDGQLKIWDVRTYKEVHSYFTPRPAVSMDISDSSMLGVAYGTQVQVWKDAFRIKQKSPYMTSRLKGAVRRARFCPFEDVLAVSTDKGISSLVIPGAGEANFDTFEANPFETKKQRRERTVVKLLEKLQADMIALDPNMFGLMDQKSKTMLDGERRALKEEKAKETLEEANKQRGRNRSSKRWKRKRKNIIDFEFEERKEKIKKLHHLRAQDKKDAARKAAGKAKDTLDRFARNPN